MKVKSPKYCHQCGKQLTRKKEEGINRLYCKACRMFVYENPLPVAAVLCINDKKEILLIQRAMEPGIGRWALPSGFIELNEAPDKAALRELYEETGIKGRIVRLLDVSCRPCGHYKCLLNVCYLVKAAGGRLKKTREVLDLGFFPVKKLKQLGFVTHKRAVKEYLKSL
jgi:ADP-ribose pyrophosphatase YjhB (NUDIX family)